MFPLILLLLSLYGVQSDSHSLRFCCTAVSAPGSGLPEFAVVGYVDDQQIQFYSSDTGKAVPVAPWMKKNVGPDYWEMESQNNKVGESLFRHEVKIVRERFNHTRGLHFVQVMHSCELRDDGSTKVYDYYRYDGREYMYLDVPTATYIPTMSEAQITTQGWNSPNIRMGEWKKNTLENECVEKLKMFLEHGRKDLERRVRPGVKVSHQELGDITKLHCQVYGFHPRAVDVKWMKNEVDDVPSYESTGVLPNPDGTYQTRVTVEVILQGGDSYSCYVDHSSFEEPLLVRWEPKQHSSLGVIIGVVVVVLVLAAISAGVIIYIKKKDNDGCDTSDEEMREAEDLPVT